MYDLACQKTGLWIAKNVAELVNILPGDRRCGGIELIASIDADWLVFGHSKTHSAESMVKSKSVRRKVWSQ